MLEKESEDGGTQIGSGPSVSGSACKTALMWPSSAPASPAEVAQDGHKETKADEDMWQMVNHMGTMSQWARKGTVNAPLQAVAVLCQADQSPATLLYFRQCSMVWLQQRLVKINTTMVNTHYNKVLRSQAY